MYNHCRGNVVLHGNNSNEFARAEADFAKQLFFLAHRGGPEWGSPLFRNKNLDRDHLTETTSLLITMMINKSIPPKSVTLCIAPDKRTICQCKSVVLFNLGVSMTPNPLAQGYEYAQRILDPVKRRVRPLH